MHKSLYKMFLVSCMLIICQYANAVMSDFAFRTLQTDDGLSNCQINDIFKDDRGYIWFATESGLDRYDGFRFRNFFYDNNNKNTLSNNTVESITQGLRGDLWIKTSVGYCVFYYKTEQFDRHPTDLLQSYGMRGTPDHVFQDRNRNMWFSVFGKGCYFHDLIHNKKPYLFRMSDKNPHSIPLGMVCDISGARGYVYITYNNGTIACLKGKEHKVVWVNRELTRRNNGKSSAYSTYVDRYNNVWVYTPTKVHIYRSSIHKWYDNVESFLRSYGIVINEKDILVKNIIDDKKGNVLLASDHRGLFVIDLVHRKIENVRSDPNRLYTLSSNTINCAYMDNLGGLWVGTYKNGVDYSFPTKRQFDFIPLGDVCTITEDKKGNLWCGTNDKGIVEYSPITKKQIWYDKAKTGLKSNIVVSSCTGDDGSLYFGTYNGGLACFRNGKWKAISASDKPGSLANDNVWSIIEDNLGNIVLGTLGGGVQIMDPKTFNCVTYNMANSPIVSDYINSLCLSRSGSIIVGHSMDYSVIDQSTKKITNYTQTCMGKPFPDPSINQIIEDSRGIIWAATPSGIAMYDPQNGQLETTRKILNVENKSAYAIIEDKKKHIMMAFDHEIWHVVLKKDNAGQWKFLVTAYISIGDFAKTHFNYRSVYRTHDGKILMGAENGVYIIRPSFYRHRQNSSKVLFSGLYVFNDFVNVGEEIKGRVILKSDLNSVKELCLEHNENSFTVLLATNQPQVNGRSHFIYRLKGYDDTWLSTMDNDASVSFTNLSPGTYTLQVRTVDRDRVKSKNISELQIVIRQPYYWSTWAKLIYIVIIILLIYYSRVYGMVKQKRKYNRRRNVEKLLERRENDDQKMNFFTNISHELRTPLMLILLPLSSMIKEEVEKDKCDKLKLVYRNASRMLTLVNQILDFSKINLNNEKLNATMGDIVGLAKQICSAFIALQDKNVIISFNSQFTALTILFDAEKITSVVNNLLNNAYKFSPVEGGRIDVDLQVRLARDYANLESDVVVISVADNGIGISDKDKKHLFDRFFQADKGKVQPYAGSGIGLYLVRNYIKLHDGWINVEDNPGGGTIFEVFLPIRFDVSKSSEQYQKIISQIKKIAGNATEADSCDNKKNGEEVSSATISVEDLQENHSEEDIAGAQNEQKDKSVPDNVTKDAPTNTTVSDEAAAESLVEEEKTVQENKDKRILLNGRYTKPLILLVDDSADFRSFMVSEMTLNSEIVEAANGKIALKKLETITPDAIISDVMMPVMDGIEFCKRVKGDARTAEIPFIMLTARITDSSRKEGLDAGADLYVTKPFSLEALRIRITALIKERLNGNRDEKNPNEETSVISEPEKMSMGDKIALEKIDDIIKENISNEDFSVVVLGSEVCMSRVQLYRRMVSLTGSTPSEYIRNYRLKYSETLLHDNSYSVSEVAYMVGFGNPRYFSKYFIEMYGITPSQYRKKFV